MNGRKRSVMPGVHGLQHIQSFFASNLADDDAIRAHTQTINYQLTLLDRALAFDIRRPGFQPHHVLLFQLKFGSVLHRYDAFAIGNGRRKNV